MTEGVMVITAPTMRLKPVWAISGSEERACRSVVKDAMMMGGRGGSAGSAGTSEAAEELGEGW